MKYLFVWGLLLTAAPVWAAQSVSFSKSQIAPGQSVELIFSSDEPITQEPDLSALKPDFMVSGRQVQQLSSIVNGRASQSYQLIYNVYPKRAGQFELNALTLNGKRLDPVSLTVTQNVQNASVIPLVMQQQVAPGPYYPGSGILYEIKMGDISDVDDGVVNPPVAHNATVEQIGQDSVSKMVQQGRTIEVLHRKYLITPKSGGPLKIEPASFIGSRVNRQTQPRTAGELFEMGLLFDGLLGGLREEVFASAEPVEITVNPKPADWKGWWLASEAVTLTESYHMPDELKTGAPIERMLTLSAVNVPAEGLPVPKLQGSEKLKVYPGNEARDTIMTDSGITGQLIVTQVLVPLQGGEVTLPAVSVDWFNTVTGQRQTAQVPAKTVMVNGAAVSDSSIRVPAQNAAVQQAPSTPSAPQSRPANVDKDNVMTAQDMWIWLGIGIISGALIVGLAALILHKVSSRKRKKPLPDLYPF